MGINQPGLIYISNKHLDIITPTNVSGAPDLTVEVPSPTRIDYDRRRKKAVYEKFGVREYWVIDPVNKSLEVWSNGGRGFVTKGHIHPDGSNRLFF
ncbi:MAG: Uma2 family endonuclease [Firmicutes bacterium]|nr:Uma2 family endonuclease [Bacillota bacterium]MCL5039984.1 Uma2 family endonuclease [Bacillota bacterium]